jgi:glycopeptide antibiotics resistance protein
MARVRLIWLLPLVLIAFILLPYGWVGDFVRPYYNLLNALFVTEIHHAIGHALQFFALVLLTWYCVPAIRTRPLLLLTIVLLAGIGQECFQLIYKGRGVGFNEFQDLIADLVGGMLGLITARWLWPTQTLSNRHDQTATG